VSTLNRTTIAVFLLLFSFAGRTCAAPPAIALQETTSPPTMDGTLEDVCWQGLPEYTGFTDTVTSQPAKKQTFVRVCRDKENIYLAFRAIDPTPGKLSATQKKRNSSLFWKDDFVYVAFDSTHSHRDYSGFRVNPIGTQAEELEGGSANKIEWRGDWKAAAKVVEDGYNVEMAIPFSILKYDKNQDTFGICFERYFPLENAWTSWPDMGGRWDRTRFADWKDVNPPWVRPRPVFMSYMTSSSGGGESHHQMGVDIKHPFSTDMLGLLSIKPDFGTIEQNVETVDFSYTERSYGDKRPFFQDWNLPLPGSLFYSRRVPEFDIGTRFVGRQGANAFGVMNARKSGSLSDSLMTYIHNFGERSHITAAVADHQTPGRRNTVQFYMGNLGIRKGRRTHDLGVGYFMSDTSDSESGQFRDIHYDTYAGSGKLGGSVYYGHVDPGYSPELGFMPDTNMHGGHVDLDWYKDYRDRKLQGMEFWTSRNRYQRLDGSPFIDESKGGGYFGFKGGYGFSMDYVQSTREDFHDNARGISTYWHEHSPNTPGSIGYSWGRKANGTYSSLYANQQMRFSEDFVMNVMLEREKIGVTSPFAGLRRQVVTTLNYDITPEKSVLGRIVQRPGMTNVFFSYRQQVRRGTDVYIIYGDPNAEESTGRISLKLVQPLF
jgi:hypothetical protein